MSSPCLRLTNVSKGFGSGANRNEVLTDVSLEVPRGEFVAIVGFSGSGKTTLISLIAGLTSPDRGTIELDGKIVTEPGPDRGVVFQNYSLLPWLTVQGNIALAVDQVFSSWTKQQRVAHIDRYIALVGLTHARDRRPPQLSGGMRQRVALARALAMSPEILLLDEPLSALDALTRGALQTEVERIWEQDRKTVVMITNHVDEAILLADRIIPLTPGPQATLGPAFVVDLPRPRDRQAVNHDRRFQKLRSEIIEFLLASRKPTTTGIPAITEAPTFQPVSLPAGRRRTPVAAAGSQA
jgi:nitrate/nitrite transport system ATP-binding protein